MSSDGCLDIYCQENLEISYMYGEGMSIPIIMVGFYNSTLVGECRFLRGLVIWLL